MKQIFIFLAISSLFISGCVNLDSPKVDFKDYTIGSVAADGITANFNFDVTNTNPIDLNIANYSYQVFINDKKIVEQTGAGFTLSANKTSRITLPVFIKYEGVFGAALSILESLAKGEQEMSYRVEGTISGGTMGINVSSPIKAEGKLKIPSNIQIR